MLSIFSCVCYPSVHLLWRNICLVLWPIFLIGSFIFLELSCRRCLYIFEINCLSVASFAIIFSHSEGCLFRFAYSFLHSAKALKFNLVPFVYFAFIYPTLGNGSWRILLWFMSESVLPMFSSRSFIVSVIRLDLYSILSLFLLLVSCDSLVFTCISSFKGRCLHCDLVLQWV